MPTNCLSDKGNVPTGVALVVVSSLLFAIGGAAAKMVTTSVPASSVLLWRTIISAVATFGWFAFTGWPAVWSKRLDLHLVRGAVTFAGLWTYLISITMIPLASAVLLRSAAPVFVPMVAFAVYRRRSDMSVWIGACVGLAGLALIANPTSLSVDFGFLLGASSGILGAVGAVLIWRIGGIDSVGTQLLWLTIIGAMSSLIASPWLLTMPMQSDWPFVVLIAIATTGSQVVLAYAFKAAPADKVISWAYLSVIFSAIFGLVFWNERTDSVGLFGMLLVVVGSHVASTQRGSGVALRRT